MENLAMPDIEQADLADLADQDNQADQINQTEQAALLEAVAFIGETLAPLFLDEPCAKSAGACFDAVAALDPQAAAAAWPFAEPADAAAGLSLMVEGLARGRADDALVSEYRRLFIGPAPKPAPPWGSVYTDKECVVFGLTTLELRRWMRANGIARTVDERTPEDHIGLMLALMAHVARTKPELLDEYLRDHLLTWSSHFLEEFEQAAAHPFYRGLARLTRSSLEGIGAARGLQVTYPRFYR